MIRFYAALALMFYVFFLFANELYHTYWGDYVLKTINVLEHCYIEQQDWEKGKFREPPQVVFRGKEDDDLATLTWADCDWNGKKFTLYGIGVDDTFDPAKLRHHGSFDYIRPYGSRPLEEPNIKNIVDQEKKAVFFDDGRGLFLGYFSRIDNPLKPWLSFHWKKTTIPDSYIK